ncbi:MAG: hypothetical protein V7640_4047, partial [Betaproteobacteria bacterium]
QSLAPFTAPSRSVDDRKEQRILSGGGMRDPVVKAGAIPWRLEKIAKAFFRTGRHGCCE